MNRSAVTRGAIFLSTQYQSFLEKQGTKLEASMIRKASVTSPLRSFTLQRGALPSPGLFPLQRGKFRVYGMLKVGLGMLCPSLLALFNIVDRLGGRNPILCFDVVYGRLHALGVVLRKESQVFVA